MQSCIKTPVCIDILILNRHNHWLQRKTAYITEPSWPNGKISTCGQGILSSLPSYLERTLESLVPWLLTYKQLALLVAKWKKLNIKKYIWFILLLYDVCLPLCSDQIIWCEQAWLWGQRSEGRRGRRQYPQGSAQGVFTFSLYSCFGRVMHSNTVIILSSLRCHPRDFLFFGVTLCCYWTRSSASSFFF